MTYEQAYVKRNPGYIAESAAHTGNVRRAGSEPTQRTAVRTRVYPSADPQAAQLVNKLRGRGSANMQSILRATSTDLMQNAYNSVPQINTTESARIQRQRGGVQHTQPVTGTAQKRADIQKPEINTYYSPYSSVNRPDTDARPNGNIQQPRNGAQQPAQKPVQNPARKAAVAPASNGIVKRSVHTDVTRAQSAERIHTQGVEYSVKRVPFFKTAVITLLLFCMFFMVIFSVAKNFEYRKEVAALQTKVDELSDRAAALRLAVEERDDLAAIEERAREIGMVKSSQVETKYISLENSDTIENFSSESESGLGSLTTMLNAMGRSLSRFFGDN